MGTFVLAPSHLVCLDLVITEKQKNDIFLQFCDIDIFPYVFFEKDVWGAFGQKKMVSISPQSHILQPCVVSLSCQFIQFVHSLHNNILNGLFQFSNPNPPSLPPPPKKQNVQSCVNVCIRNVPTKISILNLRFGNSSIQIFLFGSQSNRFRHQCIMLNTTFTFGIF